MKFKNKDPKYKVIKTTNIILLIVFFFIEIVVQEIQGVKSPNGAPVAITFLISRYFIRKMFTKNPDFDNKVFTTIGIWLLVMILKAIIAGIIIFLML